MKIKNWRKFQHFKNRRPPWVKLYRALMDDPAWFMLDGDTSKTLVMLWLLASEDETKEGILPSRTTIAFRLRLTEKQLNQYVNKLDAWLVHDDINVISPRYQDGPPETETETETETEREPAKSPGSQLVEFEEFWNSKPRRLGANPRIPAFNSYYKAVKSGCDPAQINAAAKRWAREAVSDDPKFIAMAVTWLNQRRFEDYKPTAEDTAKAVVSDEFMRAKGFVWEDDKWTKKEG